MSYLKVGYKMLAIAGIFYELQLVTGNLYSALALLTADNNDNRRIS